MELVIVLLIKLKNILQSKLVILFIICLTVIMILVKTNIKNYDYNKLGNEKVVSGIIKDIKKNDYSSILEIGNTIIYTELSNNYLLGQKIKCLGEISLPNENTNFNLFNYRKYLLSKKIIYQMTDSKCVSLNNNISLIYKIKNTLIDRIDKMKSKGYLRSFILGDTRLINENVLDSYQNNGISHLFAISGMHVTFLILVLSFIKRKYIILFILVFYMFLAGFPISMIRAVVFYILILINKKLNLNIPILILFLYFSILILWLNPYYIYNIGFLYSFIITFYLILFRNLINTDNKYLNVIIISILIFIVSFPINIYNNFYINLLTPIFNIFFIPIVSVILFPMSFIVLIFLYLDTGYYFLWTILESISIFLANNIYINIGFSSLSFYTFIGYYALITFVMHKISIGEYKYSVFLFIVLIIHYNYIYFRNTGIIQMLDVGQGDSIIISYPNNKLNILIDTGGKSFINNNKSRVAEPIIIPTLYSLGIKEIDYLIITHGDFDHAGEVLYLLKKYKVKNVLFNEGDINELEEEIINYLNKNNINYELISKKNILYNGIELKFLNSKKELNENEDSLILYGNINNYFYIFMGDAGIETEKEIIMEYNLNKVDILKVGHHGSKNSSSKEFIDRIEPSVALISAGFNNIYGHPHKEVIDNLQFCDTYLTSIHGSIKITIDEQMLVTKVR